jgi:ribonuclease P protein component
LGRRNFARFAKAKHYRGSFIRVAAVLQTDGEPVCGRRVAFVVSKKVANRAVDRNKAKRRFRELYRKWRETLPQNIWLMFMALPEAIAGASFDELEKDFIYVCKKIASQNGGNIRDKTV